MSEKFIVIPAVIAILFFGSCDGNSGGKKGSKTLNTEKKTIMRDVSVNGGNSYNDIFLDSTDLGKFIVEEKLDDTMSQAMRDFYNVRNYEYAWFASNGLIEQSLSFHSQFCTENNCDLFNKSLENRLDKIRLEDDTTVDAKAPLTIKTELQITQRFLQNALDNNKSNFNAAALGVYIPAKKTTVMALADAILADDKDAGGLKAPLKKYYTIAQSGGWQPIAADKKKYAVGAAGTTILQVKKRLQVTGDYSAADTSSLFTPELESAIRTYQADHGYKQTGIITEDLVKDMNIPATARVGQLVINMQRMRWMPAPAGGKLIMVNIPEFVVYVNNGKENLFKMDVVVGAEGHNTTLFSGELSQVVFSPYWNVPPSIVKKEILPAIAKNSNYLAKKNMEITGHEGGLPVIRQLPGDNNALGKVKFLFPNSFNIYMHDTPEKGFFNRSGRSLSHGCIRLSDPTKMANFVLQDAPEWTPEKIDAAMNAGEEKVVRVKTPIPVVITYYTAWTDNKGALHFADDIYGQDNKMTAKMFTN